MTTRRSILQGIAGAALGVLAKAWCPGAARATEPVRRTITFKWVGGGDTLEYRDPSNWSPRGVPGDGDTVRFVCGSVPALNMSDVHLECLEIRS